MLSFLRPGVGHGELADSERAFFLQVRIPGDASWVVRRRTGRENKEQLGGFGLTNAFEPTSVYRSAGLEIEIIETRKPDKHAPETEARPPRYVSWAIWLIWSLTAVRSPKPFLTLAPASLE
jgi:hypothetical protein